MISRITHQIDEKYIREWLVLGPFFPNNRNQEMLGPFFPNDLNQDFLADAGGETNIVPKAGDRVATTDGRTLTWKRYASDRDILNLSDVVGRHEFATAYAFCTLRCETAHDVSFDVWHDANIKVWVNGKEVIRRAMPFYQGECFYNAEFGAELKPGDNPCLIKLSQRHSTWSFSLRAFPLDGGVISGIVVDEGGEPISAARVHLERDGSASSTRWVISQAPRAPLTERCG